MTKKDAATLLVNMACLLRTKCNLDYSTTRQLNEAVVIACGELMIDDILNDRSKLTEEEP